MKRVAIFDFDGTIADTFSLAVEMFYTIVGRDDRLSEDEIDRLRGYGLREVAKELKIPIWKVPVLVSRGRKLLASHMDDVQPVEGIADALNQLYQAEFELYIVSSNSKENIETFLVNHGIDNVFIGIVGGIGLFGKSKAIGRLANKYNGQTDKVVYVGDETRDIEAANHAKVQSIAVTWGYNNANALHRHHPDKIIFEPSELADYLISDEGDRAATE